MKYLEDPQVFKSKGDDYDGLFTLPSKYATILSFQIGRSVTLEGRLACLVRRTLISIMFWPKIMISAICFKLLATTHQKIQVR